MSVTLAVSSDPVELIQGSLEALYDDARRLDSHADDLDEAASVVRRRVVPGWLGSAAAGWDERRPRLAEATGAPAGVYRSAAEVLRAHAATLRWAREECHLAIALWRAGVAQAWDIGLTGVALGPGSPSSPSRGGLDAGLSFRTTGGGVDAGAETRAIAVRMLEELRTEVTLSAEAAAELLDSWCADLPDGDFRARDFLAGIWDWVRGMATMLATFNLPRHLYDSEGYWRDVRSTYQGTRDLVEHLSANPHDFNRLVLDSETWRDNPSRWWGAVAPDLLLSAAGGGGVLARLSKLNKVARPSAANARPGSEPLPDVPRRGNLTVLGEGFSSSERAMAQTLASRGHEVVLREARGDVKTSDLVVDGVDYDVYTPHTGRIDRIVGAIAAKGPQVRGGGVVVDLSRSGVRPEDIDVDSLVTRVRGVTTQVTDIIVIGGE